MTTSKADRKTRDARPCSRGRLRGLLAAGRRDLHLSESMTALLLRLAPVAVVAVAVAVAVSTVCIAAAGFRTGLWRTGTVDHHWDALIGDSGGHALHALALGLANAGGGVPATVLVLIVAVLVLRRRGPVWALTVVGIAEIDAVQVRLLKAVSARARPDSTFGIDNAFPSGHTAAAAALATIVAVLLLDRHWRALAALYPLLMGWSRTELRAHWLSDVLAGAVVSSATTMLLLLTTGLLTKLWLDRRQSRHGTRLSPPQPNRRM